jgi:hypothetical protein
MSGSIKKITRTSTPLCDRGFLTAIKKFPNKSIKTVTSYANEVCSGNKPDLHGKRKTSPYFKIIDTQTYDPSVSASVRPLYPTVKELKRQIKGGAPAVIDNYIIGIIDKDGDLHMARPEIKK